MWNDQRVSVKHSVGEKARFLVGPSRMAWDCDLAANRGPLPYDVDNPEGWRGHEHGRPQHWCDLYVFVHLPAPLTQARVLDSAEWRFTVLGRPAMHVAFGGGSGRSKSASIRTLRSAGAEFGPGTELPRHAAAALAARQHGVPPVDMRTREQIIATGAPAPPARGADGGPA